LPLVARDELELLRAEDLLHQARVLVTDTAQRAQAFKRLGSEVRAKELSAISQSLISAVSLDELAALRPAVARHVGACILCLLDKNAGRSALRARVALHVDADGRSALEAAGETFDARMIVPDRLLPEPPFTLLVEPLAFKAEPIGYVLFEL